MMQAGKNKRWNHPIWSKKNGPVVKLNGIANFEHLNMAYECKAYSISYQISTHKQVFVTLSSCIGLKRIIGGSVLRAVLQNYHFRVASLLKMWKLKFHS